MTESTKPAERYAANAYRLAAAALIARATLGADLIAPHARHNFPPDQPAPFPTEEERAA